MTHALSFATAALLLGAAVLQPVAAIDACRRCGWRAPGGAVKRVKSVDELERAVSNARAGETILIAAGTYTLRQSLELSTARVTIRGEPGAFTSVILQGGGMTGDGVGVGVSVSAPDVTLADLTLRAFRSHAIQVRGEAGASRFTLHNASLQDAGQQLLKGSVSGERRYADDGLVACSELTYTTSAPSDYTNGVDLLATRGWVIRDNHFSKIRGPESNGWKAGPAILVWVAAAGTRVERNVIVDSYRGIALGLSDEPHAFARDGERAYDHSGGVIRNNVIVNLNPWADEAIEANAARDLRIEHNTVFIEGHTPWAMSVRFESADALVRNNLTNRRIFLRNGGRATLDGNVQHAQLSWFVDPARANLRLTPFGRPAVDAGVAIPDALEDFDRAARPVDRAPDAGAFEVRPVSHPRRD